MRIDHTDCIVTAQTSDFTNSEWEYPFPTSSIFCPLFCWFCYSDWSKVKSQTCFDSHFPSCWGKWIFLKVFSHYFLFFYDLYIEVPRLFLNWSYWSVFWVLCIFWTLILCQIYDWRRFYLIIMLPFHSVDCFFSSAETSQFY